MTEHRSEWINFDEEEKKSQEHIKASLDMNVTVKGEPMNRLESIKERLKRDFYVKSHPTWGKDASGADDVTYLLQRLERYETALQQIKYDYEQSLDHDITMKNMYREAIAALKEP